jgi:hypothetical protein
VTDDIDEGAWDRDLLVDGLCGTVEADRDS